MVTSLVQNKDGAALTETSQFALNCFRKQTKKTRQKDWLVSWLRALLAVFSAAASVLGFMSCYACVSR